MMAVGLMMAEILLPTTLVLVCFGAGAIAAGMVAFATPDLYVPVGHIHRGLQSLVFCKPSRLPKKEAVKRARGFGLRKIIGKQAIIHVSRGMMRASPLARS
ncbi:MAG: hypothetical protein V2G42_04455 [bacterium JZ-2024 1]